MGEAVSKLNLKKALEGAKTYIDSHSGQQWTVLDKNTVISANGLRAIENSKKPVMWFDGYYYTPITSMDVNSEWGYGYIEYLYNNYRYSIGISYDGDDWDQPVTWGSPYTYQLSASLSAVNQNGGVQVSQNISGKNISMWLYPDWGIPNFVSSRLALSSTTKSNELMTRYSQPQNIVKTGRVFVDTAQTGIGGYEVVDISDLRFASTDDYMVMVSLEDGVGTDTALCSSSFRHPDSFRVNVSRLSPAGSGLENNFYVNYMVLANKYYELYSTSTAITNSTASGDKYTWAKITTDKSAYSDFSVLKNGPNGRLRVYAPNSTTPAIAQYDTEGTETQDAEYFYYPIKWANPDGTSTPLDNFVYLARSRKGGQDNSLWLASAPSTDGLDTYQCPAIDKVTIVREK